MLLHTPTLHLLKQQEWRESTAAACDWLAAVMHAAHTMQWQVANSLCQAGGGTDLVWGRRPFEAPSNSSCSVHELLLLAVVVVMLCC